MFRLLKFLRELWEGDPANPPSDPIPPVKVFPSDQLDVAYGSGSYKTMDIYTSKTPGAPVIFMVHGGGWHRGDKRSTGVWKLKVSFWRDLMGYTVICVNYPLPPPVNNGTVLSYPAQMGVNDPLTQARSLAEAIAFAQTHTNILFHGDPNKFILMGHSAGAHLVSLLSTDPTYLDEVHAAPILGTISLDSAAYNVYAIMTRQHPSLYDDAWGKDKFYWKYGSPFFKLTTAVKPMFLVYSLQRGEGDSLNAQAFYDRCQNLGMTTTVLYPIDLSHGEIDSTLGDENQYTKDVQAFIEKLLKL